MKTADKVAERRHRINLSENAFLIITNDRYTFATQKPISYSDMICHAFLSAVEESFAKKGNKKEIERFLELKPMRAQTIMPSIQNKVMEYLSDTAIISIIDKYFSGSPGKFIKTVIEEYAEKPFTERELLFFKKTVVKINQNKGSILRIIAKERTLYFKPYEIMTDKQSTYNYLVGYSSLTGKKDSFIIACLRLSRIKNIYVEDHSPLKEYEINNLKEAIICKGVQFLLSEVENIVVKFSDVGKTLFNTMAFQRPIPVNVNGDIYHFSCTEIQAEFYFFKFGAEAIIIEPQRLHDKFAKRYKKASEQYLSQASKDMQMLLNCDRIL